MVKKIKGPLTHSLFIYNLLQSVPDIWYKDFLVTRFEQSLTFTEAYRLDAMVLFSGLTCLRVALRVPRHGRRQWGRRSQRHSPVTMLNSESSSSSSSSRAVALPARCRIEEACKKKNMISWSLCYLVYIGWVSRSRTWVGLTYIWGVPSAGGPLL